MGGGREERGKRKNQEMRDAVLRSSSPAQRGWPACRGPLSILACAYFGRPQVSPCIRRRRLLGRRGLGREEGERFVGSRRLKVSAVMRIYHHVRSLLLRFHHYCPSAVSPL